MKRSILLIIINMFFIKCFCQDSIVLKGPYEPKSKYENSVVRETVLDIKPEGDSAVIAEMIKSGALRTEVERDTFRSGALIYTGKLNAHDEYTVVTKMSLNNKNKAPFDYVILYGSAHRDSVPHIDSIDFEPKKTELNIYKKQMLQNFKSIINYLTPPVCYFRKGDTASTETVIPSNVYGLRLNYIINTTYKLIDIRKGLAYFDLKFNIQLKFPDKQAAIMNGKGSGNGVGNFTYNIKKRYFPFNESNIFTKAVLQFYNPSNNKYIKLNVDENMHTIVKNKKIK